MSEAGASTNGVMRRSGRGRSRSSGKSSLRRRSRLASRAELSDENRPLLYAEYGDPKAPNVTLVFALVHGDENTPLYLGLRLAHWLKENESVPEKHARYPRADGESRWFLSSPRTSGQRARRRRESQFRHAGLAGLRASLLGDQVSQGSAPLSRATSRAPSRKRFFKKS